MAVSTNDFFDYIDDFLAYRQQIYQISDQTVILTCLKILWLQASITPSQDRL